jgi:hypothetical protein
MEMTEIKQFILRIIVKCRKRIVVKVMFQFRVGTPPELKSSYIHIINSAVSNFIPEKSKCPSYMETDLYQI